MASDEVVKELEREAYIALLRALFSNPRPEAFRLEGFVTDAREFLGISNELNKECREIVQQDLEMIAQGQQPAPRPAVRNFGTPGSYTGRGAQPPGEGQGSPFELPSVQEAWSQGTVPSEPSEGKPARGRGRGRRARGAKNKAIGAPGSSRGRGRPLGGGAFARTPSTLGRPAPGAAARQRSTRSAGAADPRNYLGRRVWRYYPDEDPARPWVEGFISNYDAAVDTYSILYDPNDPERGETEEHHFDLNAVPAEVYVLGDYVDLAAQIGSQRVAERPLAAVLAAPAAAAAAGGAAPSKRRRPSVKVPPAAPFPRDWFAAAVGDASHEELRQMLHLLDAREAEIVGELAREDVGSVSAEELEQRAELERQFEELCRREAELWEEYAGHVAALAGEQ